MDTPSFSNRFGTVTPTRVALARGGTEEIALRQITAIRDEIDQHRAVGTVVGVVGAVAVIVGLVQAAPAVVIAGLIALGFAVVMALPRPRITLHLTDGRTRVQRGRIGTVDDARQFAAAVRAHLFAAAPVTHR
jgi:hypothetical protein